MIDVWVARDVRVIARDRSCKRVGEVASSWQTNHDSVYRLVGTRHTKCKIEAHQMSNKKENHHDGFALLYPLVQGDWY
jgi:hypothetical protein